MRRRSRPTLFLTRFRTLVAPPAAVPLAVIFMIFSFTGCLSTKVSHQAGEEGEKSGVIVRVFRSPGSAKAGISDRPGTLTELYRLDRGKETFLQRSLASEWGIDALAPGKYRLRINAIIDDRGNIRETRSGDRKTDFKVKRGKTTVVKVILKKTPTGLIVAATVTVVFIVVAIALLMGEHDVKPPPLLFPDPKFLAAPLFMPHLRPVVVAHEIWIVPGPVYYTGTRREQAPPPRVTSVIPEPGAAVSGGRVVPTLTLSQPIETARVRPDNMLMLGSKSGIVRGTTVYEKGLLRFIPDRNLAPGETVTVTVRAGGIVNPDGRRLAEDFSWGFTISP